MIRIGFFNPYPSGLGGGEKYLYTILEEAVRMPDADVVLLSPAPPDLERWRELNVYVEPGSFRWRQAGMLSVTRKSRGLDLFVAITNHFPPLSLARRSAVIIQFPFARLRDPGRRLGFARVAERRLRLRSYDVMLCYSDFVRRAIIERLEIRAPLVIAPPVDTAQAPPSNKGLDVIAVGRFFPSADANNKKHDVLIDAFRRLSQDPRSAGWTLHLAGGCYDDPDSVQHLRELRARAHDLPVRFYVNAERGELASLYAQSALFWHAAGHGETQPERFEHFGITTVEAMAHGCVPIVPALGGQTEIVADGRNGRLWRSVDELVAISAALMDAPQHARALAATARHDAERFGKGRFLERIRHELLRF